MAVAPLPVMVKSEHTKDLSSESARATSARPSTHGPEDVIVRLYMRHFAIVEHGRPPRFTSDEQTRCVTLWCIARSPLIFGGDLMRLDMFTRELLTNSDVLAVNQHSANNRQLSRIGELLAWVADVPGSRDRCVALLNAQSAPENSRVAVSGPISLSSVKQPCATSGAAAISPHSAMSSASNFPPTPLCLSRLSTR